MAPNQKVVCSDHVSVEVGVECRFLYSMKLNERFLEHLFFFFIYDYKLSPFCTTEFVACHTLEERQREGGGERTDHEALISSVYIVVRKWSE